MFSHVTVGTNDVSRAVRFYDAVFSVLGIPRYRGDIQSGYAGWGRPDDPKFWVFPPFDEKQAAAGNGTHFAFVAQTRQMVRRAYEMARSLGAVDEGAPGLRLHYHENYYGAYFRDLDGNKLQVVCHLPEDQAGA